MFCLTVLPASDGDCLILSWGDPGSIRHIVVDGGRAGAYRHLRPKLVQMARAGEPLDLFVLSHIDADHIAGALKMVEDEELPVTPGRVWYNGFDQLSQLQPLGEDQGDRYSKALAEREWPLNPEFGNGIASVETAPRSIQFGELSITLLSPDRHRLADLHARWDLWRDEQAAAAAEEAAAREESPGGMVPLGRSPMPDVLDVDELARPGRIDREEPNGSSIAFIAEWRGKRVLLAADAHPDLLVRTVRAIAEQEGGRLRVDLMKVAHHGSKKNTTAELVQLLDCRRFVFSSNGKLHGHPDPEAIARILLNAPAGTKHLYFNYDTDRTRPWDNAKLKSRHDFECHWPDAPGKIEIEI